MNLHSLNALSWALLVSKTLAFKKYDIASVLNLRLPRNEFESNGTLLFECLNEIRKRLANAVVPGLCTLNSTGMQANAYFRELLII